MKIDYAYLSHQPSASELASFKKDTPKIAMEQAWVYPVSGIASGLFAIVFTSFIAVQFPSYWFVTLALGVTIGGIVWNLTYVYGKKQIIRRYQLYNFSRVNNFAYIPKLASGSPWGKVPQQPGMIFGIGHSERIADQISHEQHFELANYYYVTGSGKNQQSHDWAYLKVPLKRRLPHMVLDAKKNNSKVFGFSLSNLPISFKKDQTLQLEGDFNNYFTLYAPKQYERDALYVFTPDLMALLIDETHQYDVEIIDDVLYVYSPQPLAIHDPKVFEHLMKIVTTVGNKMINATDRYADERVANATEVNIVSGEGARLKQGFGWSIVVTVIFIIIYAASIFL